MKCQCLVCRDIYKTIDNGRDDISHGVCDRSLCAIAYFVRMLEGFPEAEIKDTIQEYRRDILIDKAKAKLKACCHSDGLTRSFHKPAGNTRINIRSPHRCVS